jgi:CubicO group peptidase (beta-lactamase class C family)
MKITYLLLFVLMFASACQTQKNEEVSTIITDKAKARLDSTLKSFVDAGYVVGASALIFEKNKEVYYNAFGLADREANTPMDRNTLVRIYSMTKPVTGTALMKLYEQGAFQLDDPLSKYAPEFTNMNVYKGLDDKGTMILEPAKRAITIRDLTHHTSGFISSQDSPLGELIKKTDAMNKENTLEQMAKKFATLPLAFHPGEQWAYGPSVDLQAFLVERISGIPYGQFVQENVLSPLELTNTRYTVPPTDTTRLAAMYFKNEQGTLDRITNKDALSFNLQKWPLTPGGYGLTSTLDDYMRFARMLVNEGTLDGVTILKPETIKLMATNQLDESITERMWLPSKGQVGFGIDFAVRLREPLTKEENNGTVGEFFWDGAASTLFWVDPKNELTAVLFVQIMPFAGQVHKKFRDAVYGAYEPASIKPAN